MVKLYHFPRTRSSRALWTAKELGMNIDVQLVNLRQGEQKQPDYLAVNPHGWVPSFQDDELGATLLESGAICLHLLEKSGKKEQLLPAEGTKERAMCYHWMFYAPGTLDGNTIPFFIQKSFVPEPHRDQNIIRASEHVWKEIIAPYLSNALGENTYLCGDTFTVADIMVGYDLILAEKLGVLSGIANLEAYVQRLMERPAFQAATAAA